MYKKPKNTQMMYLTRPSQRNYYHQKNKKLDVKIKKAKKYNSKLRGKNCELCGFCLNLVYHHVDYATLLGFTVCRRCHARYCKEGRLFEDSLRLYEEKEKRAVNFCSNQEAMPVS